MKNKFEITNNMVALLALVFIIISALGNYIVYNAGPPTGKYYLKGPQTAQMSLCLNDAPRINNECGLYSYVLEDYYCFLNATDTEGRNLSYGDNSSLFDITDVGTIEFMPLEENIGYYKTIINVNDNTSCSNAIKSKTIDLYVCMEPLWNNFKNSLTTNLSNLSCWNAVENFTIGTPNNAFLNFTPNILSMDGYYFDSYLNLSNNYISVNISELSSLNTSVTITLYDLNFNRTIIIWNNDVCDNSTCTIISYENGDLTFNVSEFYGAYFVVDDINLSIWDSTDNYTRYINELVNFYVNFTYKTGGTIENGVCNLRFNTDGSYSDYYNMTYNSLSKLYEYNSTFDVSGIHYWDVLCNTTELSTNKTDTFNITNRDPLFYGPMPNETWEQNKLLTGRDLDDYFIDPDNETLTFTFTGLQYITAQIDLTTHIITLVPQIGWHGNETIIYIAKDAAGSTVVSNVILLVVVEVPALVSVESASEGGGGAPPQCYENWECFVWGECLSSGIQTRSCIDKNNCGTTANKPEVSRNCEYIPTCHDNIKNGNEEGVDCGGSCTDCPTCYDSTQNQGEDDVDCGGPCPRCPDCGDGLKNGDEEGVDCGGSCADCPTCYDGVLNGYEEGVDCGGSCADCPTCYDNIKNGNEEGRDCGGDCVECVPLFAPLSTKGKVFLLILILLVVLIVIYILLRKKINYTYIRIKEKFVLFLTKFKKEEGVEYKSILEEVIEKLIELEREMGKEKTKELFDDLFYIVKGFFTDLLNIDYEFTYEELEKELKKQKTSKKLIKSAIGCYKEIEESRYTEKGQNEQKLRGLVKKTKNIVKNFVLLKKITKEEQDIATLVKKGEEFIKKKDKLNGKVFYMKSLKAYKDLDEKEKIKYYNKIKKLHGLLSEMKQSGGGKRLISIVLVFASVFFLSFFVGPQKTGFVVFEDQPLGMENMSIQHVTVGERYYSEIGVIGGVGELTFFDNTDLFEVSNDGVIDFVPKQEQKGLHKIVVIVEDEEMNRDHRLIKFKIE